jgi:F-type H+-transporting ATPase subunit delta
LLNLTELAMRMTKRGGTRAARRLYRLCLVDGGLDESRVRRVVRRIVESRRRGMAAVLTRFERLVRIDLDRHTAHVESAVPVSAELRARLEADIERRFGRGMHAAFSENAGLIGGLRMRVGSHVYDDTVRGRLDAIETRL